MDLDAAAAFLADTARNSRLAFTPDALQAAAIKLAASVARDPNGALAYTDRGHAEGFRIEAGKVIDIPVSEHVGRLILAHTTPVPDTEV